MADAALIPSEVLPFSAFLYRTGRSFHLLLDILQEMHEDIDYEKEKALVTDKILDSFDLVSLVSELTDAFDIEITAKDFVEENFNSLDTLVTMVKRLQEE